MKSSRRMVLFLLFIVLIGTIMFTACSKKQEFVVKSITCTTNRELNDDLIWIGDVNLYGDIDGTEYSIPAQTAFSNSIVDYHAEYASESKHDISLSYLHLQLRNDDGEEWEIDVKAGDRFEIIPGTASMTPVFVLQK